MISRTHRWFPKYTAYCMLMDYVQQDAPVVPKHTAYHSVLTDYLEVTEDIVLFITGFIRIYGII